MLLAITTLLLCQLAGEVLARALGLPVPGPVIGLAMLFALMLVGLQLLLTRTRAGLAIRAVSANPLGAKYVGIDTDRTIILTFALGSMMGAAAGILVGLYYGAIFPAMGFVPGINHALHHGLRSGQVDICHADPRAFCAKAFDMRDSVSRSTFTPAISISASTRISGRSSVS